MGIGKGIADDQIGKAIAVDVARGGHRRADRRAATQLETVSSVQARKVDIRTKSRSVAEHHIAGPDVTDDQVGKAVAIDIARRGHRNAGSAMAGCAADLEAVACH